MESITEQVRKEIQKLNQVLKLLEGSKQPKVKRSSTVKQAPKRTMSAAARKKIAAAQRARWAKIRAGKK
jgi:hypothetical protein